MKKEKLNNKGFTLFELLVSISIIALLTAIAVVSFGGVNKKARDSKRKSDIGEITLALENYRQVNGSYPDSISDLVSDYLQKEPTDPKEGSSYFYNDVTSYTYILCAPVELENSVSSDQTGCSGLPAEGYSGYYKVVNP